MITGRRAVVVALAGTLALAGCSDDAADPAADSSASAAVGWVAPTNAQPMSAADAQAYQGAAGAAFAPAAAQVPGMWVGVWQPEQGRTSFALGEAVKPGTAAQAGDVGRIGSLTKTFTATAVLQQVERGTLALDDTIADVLPELAATYPDIAAVTVRQLLNMSSGLPDYTADADFWREFLTDPTRVWTLDDVLTVALAKPASAAGTPAYCNTNYIVLGAMLEEVTGKSASEIVTAVVEKAGLGRTALTPPPDNAMPNPHSNGYLSPTIAAQFTSLGATIPPNNDVTNWTVSMSGTAGAMYSTVDDLLTWAGTGMGTSMLTPAMADARLTDTSELAPGEFYGLGIGITDRWLAHSGAINGWMSDMRVDRRTGAVVVTLVNIEGGLEPAKPVIDAMVAQLDVGQG